MTHKLALITGASKGLGYTLAKFLSGQNYQVIITARGAEKLQSAAHDLPNSIVVPGDVNSPAHRQQLVEAVQKSGRLDLLVNNASTLGPVPMPPLADYPPEALADVFNTNVTAPLALVQVMLPFLQGGLVVNITSDAAVGGYPGWGGYGASKAALELVSLTLANELEGVNVVTVDPGDMRTDMHQDAYPGEDISDRPLPEVTLPFWAWLFGQNPADVNGKRYKAQAEVWEVSS